MTDTSTTPPAPHLPLAELALVAVTTAAIVSFSRLFIGWSFFWPMMAVVVYSHLATMILRRRGVGVAASAAISTVGFIVLAGWLWFASSTFFGIPDASTWSAFTTAVNDSWSAFNELTAPVPPNQGSWSPPRQRSSSRCSSPTGPRSACGPPSNRSFPRSHSSSSARCWVPSNNV